MIDVRRQIKLIDQLADRTRRDTEDPDPDAQEAFLEGLLTRRRGLVIRQDAWGKRKQEPK